MKTDKTDSKAQIEDLAVFGGTPLFSRIRSTSNLVQPDVERFFCYAKQSFDSRWLTNNGPMVRELERRLGELHQTEFCISVCNGLWGIVLCAYCLALEGKNEVIMPSLTYRRMADIAAWLGLTPHFCEVSPETLGMTAATAEACINENTALIIGAQPIVNLCDIDGLVGLAADRKLPLLFDSVEAAYASHHGRMVGSFGNAECFSMHASKFLNGFEAGYVTTHDAELAGRLRTMRTFGFAGHERIVEFGLNAKLNEIHAAMALASLDDLSDQVERNRARYQVYRELLKEVPSLVLSEYDESETRTYKNILIKLTGDWLIPRSDTLNILHAENLLARPYYFPPLHVKATHYPTLMADLSKTEELMQEYLLLPCGEFVEIPDIEAIVSLLRFLQDRGEEIRTSLDHRALQ